MKVNTKIRYGLRAMLEIAKHTDRGGILQKDIASNQNISNKYLEHIISHLKVADLIRKTGAKTGYILSREPKNISVFDIYNAFEPGVAILDCLDRDADCTIDTACDVKGFWCELNKTIADKLRDVTLADLQNK